jgi:DNA polymerase III sliding clamp (beta) subunit (PCNA family)
VSKNVSSLKRGEVSDALALVRPAVGRGLFVPVLSHFCFTGDEVVGYDDLIAISTALPTSFACAVPADLLAKLLGSMTADEVSFAHDGAELRVSCGRSKVKLPALPRDAFVYKGVSASWKVHFTTEVTDDFLKGVAACLVSVGIDPTHAAQMGITWHAGPKPVLYSTDNVTMSRYELEPSDDPEMTLILPASFCRELLSLSAKAAVRKERVHLSVYDHAVVATFGEWATLFTKVDTAEAPLDFGAVFERLLSGKVKPSNIPNSWDAAFSRAAAVVDIKAPVASIEVDDEVMTVLTESSVGEVKDQLTVRAASDASQFYVDPQHVLRVSKHVKTFSCFPKALALQAPSFTHVISHCSK